jgi:hypothetical protein
MLFHFIAVVMSLAAPSAIAIDSAQQPALSVPVQAGSLTRPFVGEWTGTLEYRDYSSDEMVRLPTWLTVTQLTGNSLQFTYTYDDGPGKTVVEQSTINLDPSANTYTITSGSDHTATTYSVSGLDALLAKGVGVLTLTGKGEENNQPVDVRITLTIGRNIYMFRKETRPAGKDFKFRDGYTFTRRQPPGR